MSTATHSSPATLIRQGFDALVRELGWAGAFRFLLHYDLGRGDYAKEREEILAGIDTQRALELTELEEPDGGSQD